MKKREKKHITKKKTKVIVFSNGEFTVPNDHYKAISFLDNHPCNKKTT